LFAATAAGRRPGSIAEGSGEIGGEGPRKKVKSSLKNELKRGVT